MYYFAYASNLSKKQMLERCPNDQPPIIVPLPKLELPTWIYDPSLCSITKSLWSTTLSKYNQSYTEYPLFGVPLATIEQNVIMSSNHFSLYNMGD